MSKMQNKEYIAKFWRGNPQLPHGGYETTRTIEARSEKSALRKAKEIEKNCCYGFMELITLEEKKS